MMYRIKRQWNTQIVRRPGSIVPLGNIRQSCMLFPAFSHGDVPAEWKSENALDMTNTFYINNWLSKYSYQTIW